MRYLLLLLLGLPYCTNAAPVVDPEIFPAPFVDRMRASHDSDFYDHQAKEWEAVTLGECTEEDAWFHYYKTANYSNRFGDGNYDLAAILDKARQTLDPEGFVLNYLNFAADNDLVSRWPKLLKAYAADPERSEAYPAMISYYEITGDFLQRNVLLEKMHRAEPIPAGVIDYNYNQLQSVAPNGILITQGDADTYPSWLLQAAYDVRPDVTVINLPVLLGYTAYQKTVEELTGLDELFAAGPPSAAALLEQLATQARPVFFSATGSYHLPNLPADRLYLTGLAFQYSPAKIDNLSQIARNYSDNWRLESLANPLADSPAQAAADQLNQNYLPALLELHEFNQANPGRQVAGILPLIESLADRAGVTETVSAYLRASTPIQLASSDPGLRAKDIYKGAVYVPGGTYTPREDEAEQQKLTVNGFFMQTAEVSNADYQLFLEDLLRQRRFDLLDSVAIAPFSEEDLKELFPSSFNLEAYAGHITGNHPAFAKYPILNVSRRAAELYALWLAQVYNQDPKRIDGKNVRFRLPYATEFAFAASGGKMNAPYPWGGPYYRNGKGCLLANFNTLAPESRADFEAWQERVKRNTNLTAKEKTELLEHKNTDPNCDWENDGGYLTVPVESYYPNDYGLYNMSGNAAEMLFEEGMTMGGSWLDAPYYMQIGVKKERTLPHFSTGFRLVMEYID